ncbi:Xylose isomerase [Triticum urartu]|uniref:Xylose isomerase n=2 Tax=Triticum TaxID=4564 RepID=A0A9R1NKK3_TRITD|nr:Xylose isomerase [Triticum urartu]VAH26699.1 unnamed protein product [Triticum turgidum subsp. durum]
MRKGAELLVLLVASSLCLSAAIAAQETCPADIDAKCGDAASDDWEGEFFPGITKIRYEGPTSKKPLSYKWPRRYEIAYLLESTTYALNFFSVKAHFEFMEKLGVERWCFHDRDIAPDGKTLAETNANLDEIVQLAKQLQSETNIKPLWGTAQLFMHPRYMHGAATSPEVKVYAYAAAQVKKALEVTHYLGGENYVFWGGREGYQTLLNTDMKRELEHLANFLQAAVNHKKKIGFNGTLLIEPKPQEPTKHQYDWDVATTFSFLQKFGLTGEFKINVECNHATLSGHSCHHELETARINDILGNIDANTGDPQVGWDTDEFLTDISEATLIMSSVVKNDGLAPGGFNFDAKLRRESTDVEDLFIAHISGMDTMARGLRNVAKLIEDGSLDELVRKRYQSFDTEIGAMIEAGKGDFETLEKKVLEWGEPTVPSGKQELAEMLFQSAL